MKTVPFRILSTFLLAGFLLALSILVTQSPQKTAETEKQAAVKKEKHGSLVPFLFAGTISIVRKVYLKKEE
jgi:hypothetical protein